MNRAFSLAFGLAAAFPAAPSLLAAQDATPTPAQSACAATQHRQFDFWIGDWDVTMPDGAPAGRNRIESMLKGCVLKESWTGARGMSGTSYNAYDRRTGKWHQTWMDDRGGVLQLDGGFAGGKMVLIGQARDSSGARILNRITWQETAPGAVRQVWETSSDGGGTWSTAFDGRYRKRG